MNIDDLINHLEDIKEENGNLNVLIVGGAEESEARSGNVYVEYTQEGEARNVIFDVGF